ncbi:MAG: YbhQ family protein [Enterobacterales bacterium endosymbiont of Blomia tropicalis]|uniref:YbhQ family protein n=1 Tax=Mixta mediterraneensis TaxID=2758443 RepID=UPI0025A87BBF|nr:YbhQ family protein [Mixta mediterraneensis]MDL4913713.1 YbhQ family protein [Mixta mediterraneensis]
MKWSNRIQIITGQTYAHIALHLLVIVALVWGWKHNALVEVCSTLVVAYAGVFITMLVTQRSARLRTLGDYLEEATTTYYFGAAMMTLFLVSRVFHNSLLLACLGLVMLVGPALVSLLAKEPTGRVEKKRS